jgi:hypothetical protein
MRTVLIGSDFMYDRDGNLRPIEINTSTGWSQQKVESDEETYDLTALGQFIQENGFTKVTYVYQAANEGIISRLETLLESLNVQFVPLKVGSTAITVPYIEDSESELIIRQSYDTTALVDDVYCRDKVNFLNLIKDEEYGSQFAYMGEEGQIISNITTIPDNGNQPNFILKAVEPHYDKKMYPKFYKVSTQEELNVILENVNSDYFLMEFLYNSEKLHNNHIQVIRGLHILYPASLQGIQIGMYTKISDNIINESPSYDSETFELESIERNSYLTSDLSIKLPKLLDTDLVEMADGSFKNALELEVGDLLKTIDLPIENVDIADLHMSEDVVITFNDLENNAVYSTNAVTYKERISSNVEYVTITFEDSTNWSDTDSSIYLVEKSSSSEVRWMPLNNLQVGDKIILIDTFNPNTPTFIKKQITSIETTSEIFTGWIITVERSHLFLTKTDPTSTTSFAAIEHNYNECFDPTLCTQDGCPKGQICCNKFLGDGVYSRCNVGYSGCECT